jgi:hypothetical protein
MLNTSLKEGDTKQSGQTLNLTQVGVEMNGCACASKASTSKARAQFQKKSAAAGGLKSGGARQKRATVRVGL